VTAKDREKCKRALDREAKKAYGRDQVRDDEAEEERKSQDIRVRMMRAW
jgi:hypothetical protein